MSLIGDDKKNKMQINVQIFHNCQIDSTVIVGTGSCIGYPPDLRVINVTSLTDLPTTVIKKGCIIGAYCIIDAGASLDEEVFVDHYCRIGTNTKIGSHTYILYGTRIHNNVHIGIHCRIGGNCPDGTLIGDYVTHMGRMVHSYNTPFANWEETSEDAPRIESYSVIGANSLIIGAVVIGRNSYVAAGEIVRKDIPPKSVFYKGKLFPVNEWKGKLNKSDFFSK